MTPEITHSVSSVQRSSLERARFSPPPFQLSSPLSWGAVLGGIVAALAMQVIFMMLGAGLGFAIYHPITNEKPIEDLGTGAVVIQGISAVFSLWFGGWVAGRFTPVAARATGWLHGFLVWCAATVAGVLIVSLGAGWVLGDLSKIVGGGLSAAGKPAAAAVGNIGDLAKDAARQSGETIGSFVDEAMGNRTEDASRSGNVRAKREVSLAVARLFNPTQKENPAENRAAVVRALVDHAGMTQADADRTVTGWTETYERVKADLATAKDQAELKAREAAEKASKVLALFSLAAFVAFVLGAVSASCGGHQGAKFAFERDFRADRPV